MTDFGSRKPKVLLNTYETRNGQKMKPRNKAMLKAYEAIYEDGRLEWLDEQPKAGRHRVLVTVLDPKKRRAPEEVRRVLEATRGAWGRGKTMDEIDREIESMRAEWDATWDDPDWKPDV